MIHNRGFIVSLAAVSAICIGTAPSVAATKPTAKKTTTTKKTTGSTTTPSTPTSKPAGSASAYGRTSATLYKGAGNFTVDLSKCPKDYDLNAGITDKEIRVFASLPRSGPLSGFGLIVDGMNSYFKMINDAGGIDGRKVIVEARDDGYQPDKTKANVLDAIASNKYAAVTALGTPTNLAIWDDTNKECMPQLGLYAGGAPQWGDVENHPWTTGGGMDYASEAGLWAEYLKKEMPSGGKVGMLTFNNDFGQVYSKGFRSAIKGTNLTVVKEELHEATAPNLTNQFTNLLDALPDVLLLQTSGAFCTQAMAEVEKRSYKGKVFLGASCLSQTFFAPLIDQGLTGKDTYGVQTTKDVNDPDFQNDPFVKLFHKTVKAQGLDDTLSSYGVGWSSAYGLEQILRLAGTYQGGLNRANIMLAARAVDYTNPLILDGIKQRMNGLNDAYLTEGGRIVRYKVSDPKKLGTFYPQGPVISREGALGTYSKFLAGS